MAKTIRIQCVHGLGDHRQSNWKDAWPEAIRSAFPIADVTLEFAFTSYDPLFEQTDISFAETVKALWKLTSSGIGAIGRERGLISDVSDKVRWTAGYVVAWVEDKGFQRATRKLVLDQVREFKPDIIVAHSLGSLVTFNAFTHKDAQEAEVKAILRKTNYLTLGSQIANPFVIRNLTPGRIDPPEVGFWHHLYNTHDDVFTAPIRLPGAPNFAQTNTPFDLPGAGDHSAESYLSHVATRDNVWRPIGEAAIGAKTFGPSKTAKARSLKSAPTKRRRALLVGINDYPEQANRLEGCLNDVFTMSAVLQECGFAPEAIRTCLDERATRDGIMSRLKWLLDDPRPGDELVLYYSGHGAQFPEYGEEFEPDHKVETLVPWDFDWSREKSITDDQIFDLYSQLPYDTRLILIFDCCHSGGMTRAGGARSRGLTPPDDIRHRALKWDIATQMWVDREFTRINATFTSKKELAPKYFGADGATRRLGRASMLRGMSGADYARRKAANETNLGPYLPLIIEACGEGELSYEYRDGATSHGAFTYSLASILRRRKSLTFEQLVGATAAQLADLQYRQTPRILGPSIITGSKVPWLSAK